MYIYLNGEFIKDTEASISPFDYGYLYGIGVFETFRIYEGHPFLLNEHLERMNNALHDLNIRKVTGNAEIESIIDQLLQLNGWTNASIRLNISAGNGAPALKTLEFKDPTIMVYGGELADAPVTLQEKEAKVLRIPRNTPEGQIRLKSHHFLNNLLAKQELQDPAIEGIFLTDEGFVAEGITSNIFWMKENTLYTPVIDTGILNGITRQYVLSLCDKLGISVQVGKFKKEELLQAEECFITNSIQEIIAISRIDDTTFTGKSGNVTNELFSFYKKDRNKL
ncbi:aminodeoxychorismate lyase [Bacillus sp. Marseille-Q3570]|uniref:aminodeoxychorismate lyase n=1 Tax=Bacillus sp. Marseille-Q3570 TaxID=2963522 RepID=UPI0021B772F7|nr:aminodeoxychorismate lyase [Bacillus sp. Marseille-Q3570]